ncbi:MAG: Fe-S oxidoreductase [Desulfobacterales bacterium GWB2_56_26]|nr:MAG: Fe-S oxidoreductase [Desulfobacterales bacterium GWB2_56_26]
MIADIFTCTRCGFCCHGETTVSLDADDRKRMVQALNRPEEDVRRSFWRISGNVVQMQTIEGHCIFYDNGCSVHDGRPRRCGEWPLHPSILIDEANFRTIADSCPGINKSLSYRQFCEVLRELLNNDSFSC